VTKDQQLHQPISVPLAPDSVQQADRDSGHPVAPADKADHARDAPFSAVKYAVFVQKKILPLTTKSLVRCAFLLPSAAKLFLAEFPVTVQHINGTSPKPSSVPGTLLYCRLQPITQQPDAI
jgi:hypothetical protein